MMTVIGGVDAAGAGQALKDKHRAMRALGDYPAVAAEVVGGLGRR